MVAGQPLIETATTSEEEGFQVSIAENPIDKC